MELMRRMRREREGEKKREKSNISWIKIKNVNG